MSEMWKNWEGQVIDHKYQLRQFLGSTDHSVVFLAEFHGPEVRQCAVKFISADFPGKEQQLAAWSSASQLSHPNLLQIYGAGTCKVDEMEVLYVAMEYAEENLAQVLPHRALMAEETSEMLNAVVDVLVYLHEKNLVHGHVKPSNVLAMGERLKLSSDTIDTAGEAREMRRERSAYDAPELPDAPFTPAADVWSLGVTLVEAFTQQQAVLPFNEQADPIIPPTVREPFLEIARNALRRKPRLRWTSARIAEQLNPAAAMAKKAVAVAAGASVSTPVASAAPALAAAPVAPPSPAVASAVDVPLSKEPAIPLAKLASAEPESAALPRDTFPKPGAPPRQTVVLPNYVIPLFAGALLVIALALLPFALRHRGKSEASSVATPPAAHDSAVPASTTSSNPPAVQPTEHPPSAAPSTPAPAQPSAVAPSAPSNAATSTTPPVSRAAKSAGSSGGKGEVLDQVKPDASAKAMATISGTVRVAVKVHVDAAGNVSEATLQNAGPSRYFADVSLKAARQWVFTPPEADGHSVPSDWLIQFHYTRGGVEMSSQQVAP